MRLRVGCVLRHVRCAGRCERSSGRARRDSMERGPHASPGPHRGRSCGRHPQGDHPHLSRRRAHRSLSGRRHGDLRSQRQRWFESPLGRSRSAELRPELVPHPPAVRLRWAHRQDLARLRSLRGERPLGVRVHCSHRRSHVDSFVRRRRQGHVERRRCDRSTQWVRGGDAEHLPGLLPGACRRHPIFQCVSRFGGDLYGSARSPGVRIDRRRKAQPLRARGLRRQGHRVCNPGVHRWQNLRRAEAALHRTGEARLFARLRHHLGAQPRDHQIQPRQRFRRHAPLRCVDRALGQRRIRWTGDHRHPRIRSGRFVDHGDGTPDNR